ncbi:MAG: DUF1801 domain-containing protein [Cyclobacteriaceae bacterium]|jgi:hypothetical protein|nr:DUF1801 domain-containing protein [Cyclobacteriaceae bacterium]
MMNTTSVKKSVDDIILALPRDEQRIMKMLRALILECLPYITEKNNYGTPFYTRNRMMFFIWPPSIYWRGNSVKSASKGVTFGFCQGNLMSNDDGALLAEGRKHVYCMYIKHAKEIDEAKIRALIFEADLIDQQFKKRRVAT